jgi:hypothetical protein
VAVFIRNKGSGPANQSGSTCLAPVKTFEAKENYETPPVPGLRADGAGGGQLVWLRASVRLCRDGTARLLLAMRHLCAPAASGALSCTLCHTVSLSEHAGSLPPSPSGGAVAPIQRVYPRLPHATSRSSRAPGTPPSFPGTFSKICPSSELPVVEGRAYSLVESCCEHPSMCRVSVRAWQFFHLSRAAALRRYPRTEIRPSAVAALETRRPSHVVAKNVYLRRASGGALIQCRMLLPSLPSPRGAVPRRLWLRAVRLSIMRLRRDCSRAGSRAGAGANLTLNLRSPDDAALALIDGLQLISSERSKEQGNAHKPGAPGLCALLFCRVEKNSRSARFVSFPSASR